MAADEENFYRISHIVLDIIPKNLRPLFKSLWDRKYPTLPWDDTPASGQNFFARERNQAVKNTVNQNMLHGDSEEFDGTTLFAILLYSSQKFLHGRQNVSALIDQLRMIRNQYFAHLPRASLTNHDYQAVIVDTKCCFAQFGWPITSVCDVETKCFNETQVKKLENALLESNRNDNLENRLKSLETRLDVVEAREDLTKVKLENVEGLRIVAESNADKITSIQSDMACSIKSLKTRVDEAEEEILASKKVRTLASESAEKIGVIQSDVASSIRRLDILDKERMMERRRQESKEMLIICCLYISFKQTVYSGNSKHKPLLSDPCHLICHSIVSAFVCTVAG